MLCYTLQHANTLPRCVDFDVYALPGSASSALDLQSTSNAAQCSVPALNLWSCGTALLSFETAHCCLRASASEA